MAPVSHSAVGPQAAAPAPAYRTADQTIAIGPTGPVKVA